MATVTIKCPECGGDRTRPAGANQYVCEYCGSTFVNASQAVEEGIRPQVAMTRCHICGGEIPLGAQKCRHCGEWLSRPIHQSQPIPIQTVSQQQYTPSKSKVTAALLAFFLGGFGVHEFYLGRNGAGVAFLLCFIFTSWMVWPMFVIGFICLIQSISYLCMSDQTFAQKYG